jgi:ABC-type transporter Mla MlaB component
MDNKIIIRSILMPEAEHLSLYNRVEVATHLAFILDSSNPDLVDTLELDISHIDRMDSMSIALLVSFKKELTAKDITLVLIVSGKMMSVFDMLLISSTLGCKIKDDTDTNSNS